MLFWIIILPGFFEQPHIIPLDAVIICAWAWIIYWRWVLKNRWAGSSWAKTRDLLFLTIIYPYLCNEDIVGLRVNSLLLFNDLLTYVCARAYKMINKKRRCVYTWDFIDFIVHGSLLHAEEGRDAKRYNEVNSLTFLCHRQSRQLSRTSLVRPRQEYLVDWNQSFWDFFKDWSTFYCVVAEMEANLVCW